LEKTYFSIPNVEDRISFLRIKKEEKSTIMLYINPYQEELPENSGVTWTEISAIEGKSKLYEKESGNTIIWKFRGIKGNITQFLNSKLREKWLKTGEYRKNKQNFTKEVSRVMKTYIHVDYNNYSKYIAAFLVIIKRIEKDAATLLEILQHLVDSLKDVVYKDKREGLNFHELLNLIKDAPTHLKISECSKKCHDEMKKLDFETEKSNNFIDDIIKEGEAQILQSQQNLEELDDDDDNNSIKKPSLALEAALKKREREDDDDDETDEPPKKKKRIITEEEKKALLEADGYFATENNVSSVVVAKPKEQ